MSERSITVAEMPTTEQDRFVRVDVSHSSGRYSLSIYPFKRTDGVFSCNVSDLLEVRRIVEAPRYSGKVLKVIADGIKDTPEYQTLLAEVLAKHSITLKV